MLQRVEIELLKIPDSLQEAEPKSAFPEHDMVVPRRDPETESDSKLASPSIEIELSKKLFPVTERIELTLKKFLVDVEDPNSVFCRTERSYEKNPSVTEIFSRQSSFLADNEFERETKSETERWSVSVSSWIDKSASIRRDE